MKALKDRPMISGIRHFKIMGILSKSSIDSYYNYYKRLNNSSVLAINVFNPQQPLKLSKLIKV